MTKLYKPIIRRDFNSPFDRERNLTRPEQIDTATHFGTDYGVLDEWYGGVQVWGPAGERERERMFAHELSPELQTVWNQLSDADREQKLTQVFFNFQSHWVNSDALVVVYDPKKSTCTYASVGQSEFIQITRNTYGKPHSVHRLNTLSSERWDHKHDCLLEKSPEVKTIKLKGYEYNLMIIASDGLTYRGPQYSVNERGLKFIYNNDPGRQSRLPNQRCYADLRAVFTYTHFDLLAYRLAALSNFGDCVSIEIFEVGDLPFGRPAGGDSIKIFAIFEGRGTNLSSDYLADHFMDLFKSALLPAPVVQVQPPIPSIPSIPPRQNTLYDIFQHCVEFVLECYQQLTTFLLNYFVKSAPAPQNTGQTQQAYDSSETSSSSVEHHMSDMTRPVQTAYALSRRTREDDDDDTDDKANGVRFSQPGW